MPLSLRQFSATYLGFRILWFIFNVANDEPNDERLYFESVSFTATLVFCILMILPLKFRSLEPQEGRLEIHQKHKKILRWPTIPEIWQLLGTNMRRMLTILCFLVACAEGVVRVLTFQALGIALVSCVPKLATCETDYSVMYHDLPGLANVAGLIPFFSLAISVGFLRAGVRILSCYVLQMTINHLKDELFGRAMSSTRIYIRQEKAAINQTIHYYLDREFLKT